MTKVLVLVLNRFRSKFPAESVCYALIRVVRRPRKKKGWTFIQVFAPDHLLGQYGQSTQDH